MIQDAVAVDHLYRHVLKNLQHSHEDSELVLYKIC
jgi:hypothetical protein